MNRAPSEDQSYYSLLKVNQISLANHYPTLRYLCFNRQCAYIHKSMCMWRDIVYLIIYTYVKTLFAFAKINFLSPFGSYLAKHDNLQCEQECWVCFIDLAKLEYFRHIWHFKDIILNFLPCVFEPQLFIIAGSSQVQKKKKKKSFSIHNDVTIYWYMHSFTYAFTFI